jgi:hypothetical protein
MFCRLYFDVFVKDGWHRVWQDCELPVVIVGLTIVLNHASDAITTGTGPWGGLTTKIKEIRYDLPTGLMFVRMYFEDSYLDLSIDEFLASYDLSPAWKSTGDF